MSRYSGICAGCGADLSRAREIGTSSIYDPNGPDFELCMPCWNQQEALLEHETNFQPAILEQYYATFGEKRPALYDVIQNKYV